VIGLGMALLMVGSVLAPSPVLASTITEYPVPTPVAGPTGIVLGADGNLWFTETTAGQIGRITPAGAITEFPTPTVDAGAQGITAGPDGNLWFAESRANKIGRITTAGTATEFPLPGTNTGPLWIAAGADGKLWFTEFNANKIGRISTSGTVSTFSIPTANSRPRGIAAGPDGNLWFAESQANAVARITTSGTITEFPLSPNRGPFGIATGADGNLWFTEADADRIGRMNTSGVLTGEFSVPTPAAGPGGIAAGADGNLWFTELSAGNVGQVTTSGTVTELTPPTVHSEPYDITPGPNGTEWFAEYSGNNIGEIRLSKPNISYIAYIPNRFFIPNISRLRQQGETVSWLMMNPGLHGIADTSGMGLFSTPNGVRIGSIFQFTFIGAGTYRYGDPFQPRSVGMVQVPIRVQLVSGTTSQAQVIWASAGAPLGFAFDVQVEVPGSPSFVDWRTRVSGDTAAFGPTDPLWVGPGTYSFRSRIRNTQNSAASGYSTPKSIALR
jgi:streptogramin lyase